MRSGVCYPSHARSAVWSVTGGTADADFPVTNLSNLDEIRRVFTASAAGARNILFTLPSVQSVDFLAFIHHNATWDSTFRIRLSAGLDGSVAPLYDSGVTPFWPGGNQNVDYPAVRPVRLPAPVSIRSGHIQLSATAVAWEMGGVDIGRFWDWENVAVPRSLGVDSRSVQFDASRGSAHVMRQWSPRIVSGSREVVAQTELDQTLLDFQATNGFHRPFTWAEDVDDPATWARQCMLVRNESLPPGVATGYEVGRQAFAFVEHLR